MTETRVFPDGTLLCGHMPIDPRGYYTGVVLPGRLMPFMYDSPRSMWPDGHVPVAKRTLAESHAYESQEWLEVLQQSPSGNAPQPPATRGFWSLAHGRGLEWERHKLFEGSWEARAGFHYFVVMRHSAGDWSSSWVDERNPDDRPSKNIRHHANEHEAMEHASLAAWVLYVWRPVQADRSVHQFATQMLEMIASEGREQRKRRRYVN